MPSARARSRGAFLNCRFDVNGIQKALCSRFWTLISRDSARLFMQLAYSSCTAKSLGRVGHYTLFLLAETFDHDAHHVAWLQEHCAGLDTHADAGRRAGGDDVARQKR